MMENKGKFLDFRIHIGFVIGAEEVNRGPFKYHLEKIQKDFTKEEIKIFYDAEIEFMDKHFQESIEIGKKYGAKEPQLRSNYEKELIGNKNYWLDILFGDKIHNFQPKPQGGGDAHKR